MTTQITINEYDSGEDGGPDAPQARFEVIVHTDGIAPYTVWSNRLLDVVTVLYSTYFKIDFKVRTTNGNQ